MSLTMSMGSMGLLSMWRSFLLNFHKSMNPAQFLSSLSSLPSNGHLTIRDSRNRKQYDLPIINDTIEAIMFKLQGNITIIDHGLQNTAVMVSSITHVDGIKGTIQYRGQDVGDLVERESFESVAYLLIWGHLPSASESKEFKGALAHAARPPQTVLDVIQSFPSTAPAQTMILAGQAAWSSAEPAALPSHMGKELYLGKLEAVDKQIIRSIAALASVIAVAYCHRYNRPFTNPKPTRGFIENVMLMMGLVDATTGEPDPKRAKCLEKLWILYADHEMTNSTAAFLHVASSLSDPFTCDIASVAAAYGPLHGGAINIAYQMIQNVGSLENVPKLMEDVKAKKFRLYGYGHRIYKTVDPRLKIIKDILAELKDDVQKDSFLAVAMEIDRVASQEPYFTSRNLYANADLFGGFVYTALGFPSDFILPMCMVARKAGVTAHWREAMSQQPRLWRPQQVYVGKVDAVKK